MGYVSLPEGNWLMFNPQVVATLCSDHFDREHAHPEGS